MLLNELSYIPDEVDAFSLSCVGDQGTIITYTDPTNHSRLPVNVFRPGATVHNVRRDPEKFHQLIKDTLREAVRGTVGIPSKHNLRRFQAACLLVQDHVLRVVIEKNDPTIGRTDKMVIIVVVFQRDPKHEVFKQ